MLYTNVCRGLFSKHKLIFSFLISTSIQRQLKVISNKSWMGLLKGAGILDEKKIPENTMTHLVPTVPQWNLLVYLDLNYEE